MISLLDPIIENDVLTVVLMPTLTQASDETVMQAFDSVRESLDQSDAKSAVVDFNQIPYFSSIVIEALLKLWKTVQPAGGKLVLCNLSDFGREIVQVSNLERLWPVSESREQAIKAVSEN